MVRHKAQNGQIRMFRYLDSNQDNRIQSSASCQLLNTGLETTDINSVRYLLLHQNTGHAALVLSTGPDMAAAAQPSILR
jgi:hypothetical protein